MNTTDLLAAALAWHHAGIVALPVRTDGSKAPGLSSWKAYQNTAPSIDEMVAWFGTVGFTDGIGILTGAISGQLEMVELEGRAVATGAIASLRSFAADNDASEILDRVMNGYTEITPSGGLHLLYRISDGSVRRNTKLARTIDREVLAESRGEGGFVVVAPSGARSHPSGTSWTITSGGVDSIVTITSDERDLLWAVIGMLDQEPATISPQPSSGMLSTHAIAGTRPGDNYDRTMSWEEILIPAGWSIGRRMGKGHAWIRPGKDHGISGTTNQAADGIDRLYVFSSSTAFEPEKPYTKFAAYTLLEHGGDYSAAARALAALGFGSQPIIPTDIAPVHAAMVAPAPGATMTVTTPAPTMTDLSMAAAPTLMLSEDGFSQAIIAEFGACIRYCYERGRWLNWDGFRWVWQPAGGGYVRELAKAVARSLPDNQTAELNHKKRCSSATGIANALTMAATDFRIAVSIDELDARPWELNTPGGIVDLRTGELHSSDPAKLHTRSTIVAPDFDADQSAWLTFLATTFQNDQSIIDWMQRLMGYACVGAVREAILPVFFGQGANGKTVLLETVQMILGDYATVAPQKFLVQGMTQHATEIAAIAGARLVIASETNEGERFDEAKVKILTGGDSIKARFMRQDEFTFTPSHLLVMMTNHRPEVGSGGTSFWRRLREVPFTHVVPPEKRDPELREKLTELHAPAIMAWLAQGAALYAATGLQEPEVITAATQVYEASTDTIGRFVADMCLIGGDEHVKIKTSRVRKAYEDWCAQEGETPVNVKAFGTAMLGRFEIGKSRDAHSRFYTNLSLLGDSDDE